MVKFAEDLEKARCFLVYLAMLALHVTVLIYYLRSVSKFPSVFFLFFSPFEVAGAGIILMVLGGAEIRLTRRSKRTRNRKWPPDRAQ
jgi:hypothetical protein